VRHPLYFFIQLSKRETHLPISPPCSPNLREDMLKSFVQHRGESSLHQSGYHDLAGWFHITIKPDVNHEYSDLWGQFLHGLFFKMIYVTLIVSSNEAGDVSSQPLLPTMFSHHFLPPTFLAECHTKVDIHSIFLSLPLSPLRQQPCLKAQTTEQ
jgi:hypothetical protein